MVHDYGWVGVVDDIDNVVAGLLTLTNGSRRSSLPCPRTRRPICTWTLWLTYRQICYLLSRPKLNRDSVRDQKSRNCIHWGEKMGLCSFEFGRFDQLLIIVGGNSCGSGDVNVSYGEAWCL